MYFDNHDVTFEELKERFIAIDTEFYTGSKVPAEKVFCVACSDAYGKVYKEWLNISKDAQVLTRIAEFYGIENPIFCAHAVDLAEYPIFKELGCEPQNFRWVDTYTLFGLVQNSFVQFDRLRKKSAADRKSDLAYAAMCKTVLGVDIDTAHKKEMRDLCIMDATDGHEQEILDYCASDTAYLWPCLEKIIKKFHGQRETALKISLRKKAGLLPERTDVEVLLGLCDSVRCFCEIAFRGLPVNGERCRALQKGASAEITRLTEEFVAKYPETYKRAEDPATLSKKAPETFAKLKENPYLDLFDIMKREVSKYSPKTQATCEKQYMAYVSSPDGKYHACKAKIEEYFEKCLRTRGILGRWPRTPSGDLSMDKEALSKEFKLSDHAYEEGFGGDVLKLGAHTTMLKGISGTGKKSWLKGLTEVNGQWLMKYLTLSPLGTQTGRCTPSSANGFVFAWAKALYSVLEPPEGYQLCELDFGSQEIFIQAVLYGDDKYKEIYTSKDPYLWLCAQLGLIPMAEYETLPKSELKAKYGAIRTRIKTVFLGWSYGAGVDTLARKARIPAESAQKMKDFLENKLFVKSTSEVHRLLNLLERSDKLSGMMLDDGFWIRTAPREGEVMKSATSIRNWPIQSLGALILRELVVELEKAHIDVRATIHDAVFFMVKEGDTETIQKVDSIMKKVAHRVLAVEDGMKVGSPELISHGEIWTPEHEFDEDAKRILSAGGYEL